MIDPIADMLTRIRNAVRAALPEVVLPYSRVKESIARVLQAEGYLLSVAVEGEKKRLLKIRLKYSGRINAITGLKRASSPGLRRYTTATAIPRILGGLGVVVVTTPKGVMTGVDARKNNVGGEIVCCVW